MEYRRGRVLLHPATLQCGSMSHSTEPHGDQMKALLLLSTVGALTAAATLDAQSAAGKPDSTCTKFSNGRMECHVYRGWIGPDSAFGKVMFMRMDSAMA